MDAYVGQIMMFGGNFAPRGWALCDGQLLPISGNDSLFTILRTTYGGDGRTNFALPDLRGRAPVHAGDGPGLTTRTLGQKSGTETNSLSEDQMPTHNHEIFAVATCTPSGGNSDTAEGNVWANSQRPAAAYSEAHGSALMDRSAIEVHEQNKGSGQAINNMQPYLTVNYIICLNGIYPSRN